MLILASILMIADTCTLENGETGFDLSYAVIAYFLERKIFLYFAQVAGLQNKTWLSFWPIFSKTFA
jgi:hypothetical protein